MEGVAAADSVTRTGRSASAVAGLFLLGLFGAPELRANRGRMRRVAVQPCLSAFVRRGLSREARRGRFPLPEFLDVGPKRRQLIEGGREGRGRREIVLDVVRQVRGGGRRVHDSDPKRLGQEVVWWAPSSRTISRLTAAGVMGLQLGGVVDVGDAPFRVERHDLQPRSCGRRGQAVVLHLGLLRGVQRH